MSFSMLVAPAYFFGTASAVPATIATTASTTVATTGTAATAAVTATGTAATGAAFAALAVPVAISIIGVLAAGMTLDVIHETKSRNKCHIAEIPTVFTSKDILIQALIENDPDGKCVISETAQEGIHVRVELQDYYFKMNPERKCYDLTVVNAGMQETLLDDINTLLQEYKKAVQQATYNRLMESVRKNGWTVETDEVQEDGSQYISIIV